MAIQKKYYGRVSAALWIGIVVRLIEALWFGINESAFGIGADATQFQERAIEYARNLTWDSPLLGFAYSFALGAVYSITGDWLILGCLLSVIAWALSAVVMAKMMRLLTFDVADQFKAMLVYSLMPTAIPYTSVTLREPYQLLFVNAAMYAALKIYMHKSHWHWLLLAGAAAGMGMLHGTFLVLDLFLISALLILLALRGRKLNSPIVILRLLIMALLVVGIFDYGLSLVSESAYKLDAGVAFAVQSFQEGALGVDARANYKEGVEIDGISGLLGFVLTSFFQYRLEPLPWRIGSVADVVLFLENVFCMWMIWRSIAGLRMLSLPRRMAVIAVFASYLVLEIVWSIGTINWGTASRHHIPALALLLVSAYAYAQPTKARQRRAPPMSRHIPKPASN